MSLDKLIPLFSFQARITEYRKFSANGGPIDNAVRTYRDQPERLALQIRVHGPTTEQGRKGKDRDVIAHVSLNVTQAEQLVTQLRELIADVRAG
jgi:hypothetical protein